VIDQFRFARAEKKAGKAQRSDTVKIQGIGNHGRKEVLCA